MVAKKVSFCTSCSLNRELAIRKFQSIGTQVIREAAALEWPSYCETTSFVSATHFFFMVTTAGLICTDPIQNDLLTAPTCLWWLNILVPLVAGSTVCLICFSTTVKMNIMYLLLPSALTKMIIILLLWQWYFLYPWLPCTKAISCKLEMQFERWFLCFVGHKFLLKLFPLELPDLRVVWWSNSMASNLRYCLWWWYLC